MLQFLIPFKSRSVSKNWGLSSALLRQCVLSILAQNDENYEIAICGHDRPLGDAVLRHEKVTWIDAAYGALPSNADITARRVDKKRKQVCLLEWAVARRSGGHLMFVDADDLIENRFVARMSELGARSAALVRMGYVYSMSDNLFWRCFNFQKRCGTCGVFPTPASILGHESYMQFAAPEDFIAIHGSLGGHPNYERLMHEAQLDVLYVDDPVVVRLVNYGDNHGKGREIRAHTALSHFISRHLPRRTTGTRSVWIGESLTPDVRERFNLL